MGRSRAASTFGPLSHGDDTQGIATRRLAWAAFAKPFMTPFLRFADGRPGALGLSFAAWATTDKPIMVYLRFTYGMFLVYLRYVFRILCCTYGRLLHLC